MSDPIPNPDPLDAALAALRSDHAQVVQDDADLAAAQSAADQASTTLANLKAKRIADAATRDQARAAVEALLDREYSDAPPANS